MAKPVSVSHTHRRGFTHTHTHTHIPTYTHTHTQTKFDFSGTALNTFLYSAEYWITLSTSVILYLRSRKFPCLVPVLLYIPYPTYSPEQFRVIRCVYFSFTEGIESTQTGNTSPHSKPCFLKKKIKKKTLIFWLLWMDNMLHFISEGKSEKSLQKPERNVWQTWERRAGREIWQKTQQRKVL